MLIFAAGGERNIAVTWLSTSQHHVMSCSHLFGVLLCLLPWQVMKVLKQRIVFPEMRKEMTVTAGCATRSALYARFVTRSDRVLQTLNMCFLEWLRPGVICTHFLDD